VLWCVKHTIPEECALKGKGLHYRSPQLGTKKAYEKFKTLFDFHQIEILKIFRNYNKLKLPRDIILLQIPDM